MNIVCGLPGPPGAWKRAATKLGHLLEEINPRRPFDAFKRIQPDIVMLNDGSLADAAIRKCVMHTPNAKRVFNVKDTPLGAFWMGLEFPYDVDWSTDGKTGLGRRAQHIHLALASTLEASLVYGKRPNNELHTIWLKPALDAYPDTPPGCSVPEFECDVAFVGTYRPELDAYLLPFCTSGLNVKIFGDGQFPVANYLGSVVPSEISSIYASAKVTVDLVGDPHRAMAILAAGGRCVSIADMSDYGIEALKSVPAKKEPIDLLNMVRKVVKNDWPYVPLSRERLMTETFTNRLTEILERL